jgi:fused signal recognition particle receptor
VLISDAIDSALATRNQHDYQPDTPVDGCAEASPAGTKWPEVAATMTSADIAQKQERKQERAAEKRKAKQLTKPRPGTEWLDNFSIDKERKRKEERDAKKSVRKEKQQRDAIASMTDAERLAQETKKRVAEEKQEKKKQEEKKKKKKKKKREMQLWHVAARHAALEWGLACKRQRVSQPAQQQQLYQ